MAVHHHAAFNLLALTAVVPQVATTDTPIVGEWIDCLGAEAVSFFVLTGDIADPDATFAVSLQHADLDDKSDAAAVSAADLIGSLGDAAFNFAADRQTRDLGYRPHKRYVRMTVTPTGNAAAAPIAAVAIPYPFNRAPV